jgi:hypothetical protein
LIANTCMDGEISSFLWIVAVNTVEINRAPANKIARITTA